MKRVGNEQFGTAVNEDCVVVLDVLTDLFGSGARGRELAGLCAGGAMDMVVLFAG